MSTVVIVTGGFDPLHSGHLEYFKEAKSLGDYLVVGINSDSWLTRKKGRPFMPQSERAAIIKELEVVDQVFCLDDEHDAAGDCSLFLEVCCDYFEDDEVIFANGGDRTPRNMPENSVHKSNLSFAYGIGGDNKMNSSSWLLDEWKAPKTERAWGYYRVLHEDSPTLKVKELTVEPGETLSMQRHHKRNELWFIDTGTATVYTMMGGERIKSATLHEHQHYTIRQDCWHQLVNETDEPLRVVEIQYGTECIEEDIERKELK